MPPCDDADQQPPNEPQRFIIQHDCLPFIPVVALVADAAAWRLAQDARVLLHQIDFRD